VDFYAIGCWMFGLVWAAILSELARAETPWVLWLARAVYVAGLAVVLGVTTIIVAAANSLPTIEPSHGGIWFYAVACAVPVTLLGLVFARRAYGRPLWILAATLPAIGFLVVAADAFRPVNPRLTGLAATVHEDHSLVVATLAAAVALPALVSSVVALPREPRAD
jgi:hypothetical protein